MIYSTLLIGTFVLYLVWTGASWTRQIRRATATSLQWTIFPYAELNTFWLTLCSFDSVLHIINHWLPAWLADIVNDNVMTHHFWVKDRRTKQLGKLYMVATPANICCHVADAAVISQICSSRSGFPKPLEIYGSMMLYGPNVVATEGKEWTRHRRHTIAAFGEKTIMTVWQETVRQTTQMLDHWSEKHTVGISLELSPKEDILKLTLNVLCAAGFGVQLPFQATPKADDSSVSTMFSDTVQPLPGFQFTLRAVMEYMMGHWNSIFMANTMLPTWLPRALVPFFKDDFAAHNDLGKYMNAMIAQANQDIPKEGLSARGQNVLQGLVRAQHLTDEDESKRSSLSEIEVLGNTHVMMLAHESTGATIRFALVLLALHQDIQEWMYQAICDAVKEISTNPNEWDYTTVYPKLVAPLCVMLETMRMYPPAPVILRTASQDAEPLQHEGGTVVLPPGSHVCFNITSLHYTTEYWGPEASRFDPSRWDRKNRNSFLAQNEDQPGNVAAGLEYPTIHKPIRGSYIPFSDGLRACLGKKFAQVEFVAFLAVIFSRYKVDFASAPGQKGKAQERAKKALEESVCAALALDMMLDVPLSFTPRDEVEV
ncbi:hypothetical protein N7520_011674 [Penicillium odoratum]|uniref:uncharacterized protein n=1 Tax=Penicillium odoratum TaxID=1167516 RepID=UPI00254665BE|nr:uncharacterized protein N7520_011674 [Penicillium odoratum]KAJ5746492.1 hypothetical protein N7520_011674 [Penicillium odoratum]